LERERLLDGCRNVPALILHPAGIWKGTFLQMWLVPDCIGSRAWAQFLVVVSKWLQAGPDCFRNKITFAVPPVTHCDLFKDKSGLRQVQVSLLLGRREVKVGNYSHPYE